ncbi:hypothetical protein NDU88_004965 [Pleurodeles waltl]|uniref:Uncharacterized protein n=1 Tax=Pleurodeles waltl TaxID=8319 RepID=A0AAV7M7U7_PLEWA|nr:hypothetical protein NDU88_004965 [Pleurodeles waltl]
MRRESYPCVPIAVPWRVHRAFFVLPCTLFDPSAQDKEGGPSLRFGSPLRSDAISTALGLVGEGGGGKGPPRPQRGPHAEFVTGAIRSARLGSYLLVRGGMRRPGAAPVRGPVRLLTASSGPRCWAPLKEEGLLHCRSVLAWCRTACSNCPDLRVD